MKTNSNGYDVVVVWNYVKTVGRQLYNLPPDGKEVLIKSEGGYFAGKFSHDAEEFGFYVNQDGEPTLILAEDISKWQLIRE